MAPVNSGPVLRSTGHRRSARIHSSAAARGSAAELTSMRCSGQSPGSPACCLGPSPSPRKRRWRPSASAAARRAATSNKLMSRSPTISRYSPMLYTDLSGLSCWAYQMPNCPAISSRPWSPHSDIPALPDHADLPAGSSALFPHCRDQALRPHITPGLLDKAEALLPSRLPEYPPPAIRHISENGPQGMLSLIIDQDDIADIQVFKRIRHACPLSASGH